MEYIKMYFSPIVWLASGIIIMACEIFIPGFIIFWFGAGGILTALFIFIGIIPENNAEWQWIFFFISSLFLLGFWQFVLKNKFHRNIADVSRDVSLANLKGKATLKIVPGIPGEVELYSMFHGIKNWKAESDETIEPGEEIMVIDAKGIKLIVRHT